MNITKKILANDGLAEEGVKMLEESGFTVVTEKVEQEDLINAINEENYVVLLVRSATTARKDLIDACPGLKIIGRGGVGMDNIDVEYARSKGIEVINTPAASSLSVAELVMAHMFSISRSIYDSNRNMPDKGASEFKGLKKKYGKGVELRGKTLGLIGFGRIAQATAQYAIGCGMKVRMWDYKGRNFKLPFSINGSQTLEIDMKSEASLEDLLKKSDFISIHVPMPSDGKPIIGNKEFSAMKDGVRIINASRGGVIEETALLDALNSGKVASAALDVFVNEPSPRKDIIVHPNISLTPHIGGATVEAQGRIGTELAEKIISKLK